MFPRRLVPTLAGLASLAVGLVAAAPAMAETPSDAFSQALAKGPVYAGLAAFASGFLVSLTPCVYPMVAVTVSVFGAKQVENRWQGAALSAAFVAGIIAMFVPLGVAAGLTGSLAGAVLQSRWVITGISLLFLVMAAAMFGAFELDIPSSLKNRLALIGGGGYAGAFLLGLACGPIAAPCTGPFLTGILAWIAKTQSAGFGALAMAAFGTGLGVPFFVVGAFAVQLPKSGGWMMHVKSILGVVLVVLAIYFLNNAFGFFGGFANPSPRFLGIAGAIALAGIALGAIHKGFDGTTVDRVRKGAGVLMTTFAAALFIIGATTPASALTWEHIPPADAKAKAVANAKPLIIDFGAAWCGACKELDKITFSEGNVRREAGRFVAVKVDATNDEDPRVEAAMSEFGVKGLPTVVVYDSKGNEAIRYTDFVDAEHFLAAIQKVD
jgi:thiol:disulfide interchange protein DsbD